MRRYIISVVYVLTALSCCPSTGHTEDGVMSLEVGEVKVISVPDVARVAVGDGNILNALATDEKEVIIFARHEGSSTVHVWSEDGRRRRYSIEVAPQGAQRIQQELRAVLERIPNARVSAVGDKLLIEGDNLSDGDRERVQALSKRYPQLLDFTSQVGWDSMVLLDVQVVEVPRVELMELGLRWPGTAEGGLNAGVVWDGGTKNLMDRPGQTVMPGAFPIRGVETYFGMNALLSARINALAQSGAAIVLAQPQLLARSGSTAEFLAGGEVPYTTVDANGNVNTSFKSYGVSLHITPQLERNGAVRSRIEVEVSSVDPTISLANGPALKTRRAVTEFNVYSGQTLVLAGFLSRDAARNVDGIPGLSEIPILGRLFQSTRYQNNETELAIFVTPVVVTGNHELVRQRVQRAGAVLQQAFPDKSLIGTSALTLSDSPVPRSIDSHDHGGGSSWQRSQWRLFEAKATIEKIRLKTENITLRTSKLPTEKRINHADIGSEF